MTHDFPAFSRNSCRVGESSTLNYENIVRFCPLALYRTNVVIETRVNKYILAFRFYWNIPVGINFMFCNYSAKGKAIKSRLV